jgi:hypothetical protein
LPSWSKSLLIELCHECEPMFMYSLMKPEHETLQRHWQL